MKKILIFFSAAIFILLFSTNLAAQGTASVTWALQGDQSFITSGQVTSANEAVDSLQVAYDASAAFSDITLTNVQKLRPTGTGAWTADSMKNNNIYMQFAVSPKPGYSFNATSISMFLGAKGSNNIMATIAYSTDSTFAVSTIIDTNLSLPQAGKGLPADSVVNLINVKVNAGQTLYVRVYPWNKTGDNGSTSKYMYIQNVAINGITTFINLFPSGATWSLTDPSTAGTGQTAVTTGQVTANDEYLNNMVINQYSGPNYSQRVKISNNNWPANQTTPIDTVFIQFAVSPKMGYKFDVNSISLDIASASINTMKANIYYSTDSTFKTSTQINYTTGDTSGNNYLSETTLSNIQAAVNVSVNEGQTLYLRIYPWVNNDPSVRTGKYVCLQNVVIGGNIESLPNPSTATWPWQTDQNPVTSGLVDAQVPTYSSAMKFYGFANLPTTSGYLVNEGAVQTVIKTWNAEPNPVDSMWFQYAVSPKFGGTFNVNKISFFMGGWFSSNLRAEIDYSKDSTFATKQVLIPDTALVGNKVAPFSASLNDTVNSGETFYLRVYPHDTKAEGWAKLVAVDSVVISGFTTGVTSDPPTVTTDSVTGISTTFATSGGNIPTDGGAPVTARGVVWDTASNPTTANSKTLDGNGSGSFTSQATNLTAGTTYYLRAYATNDAGTSYGAQVTFRTLDSTGIPTVTTASVSNIMVKTADCGGTVTAWGGDSVTARGVCWNTSGNPTIADNKTVNGTGLGSFTSTLYPLTSSTTYYVRAYATNNKGTAYGVVDTFKTQSPAPTVMKVVAKDGSGDYTTVQAAFDAVPDNYTGTYIIFVKNGTYKEKLQLAETKVNVLLEGESRDSTILTYDDYAGKNNLGTSGSYSTDIEASDFTAMNITFQNTVVNDGSQANQQAVALETNGDRESYYNCNIEGYQDTYYSRGGHGTDRIYMKDCYISGSVDFIFGRDIVVFDSCEIHENRNGGTLTAASTDAASMFGYVFLNCKITADSIGFDGKPITDFDLGRPWQGAPRTVYINCYEPASLDPAGWLTWNVTPALYAEYNCSGPGYLPASRIASISTQLTATEAANYTLQNIFAKSSNPNFAYDWMPVEPIITGLKTDNSLNQIPKSYQLYQNYPNPFNPSTTIRFDLPKESQVTLDIYNILGQRVASLIDQQMKAGVHEYHFDASRLSSGVYFYRITAANFTSTKKLLLLK